MLSSVKESSIVSFKCSNKSSDDWYLFQCTELVNRLLYERSVLPHLPGNAARYYDYYHNGVLYPGTIRAFPAGSYQLSTNASQGTTRSVRWQATSWSSKM
jgi:hypothetical protein